jgi:nicotinate-nucleotide pyrophosphorylase (carboxylating)
MEHAIPPTILRQAIDEWIGSDIPAFDVGGAVVGNGIQTATFLVKSNLVLAGLPFVNALMKELGCSVVWDVAEGTWLQGSGKNRIPVGTATGPVNRLLQVERTALEILTRCSSCATVARQLVEAATKDGWKGKVAATRKTTPGAFRMIEKYGALIGGADPHRYSLSSMVMLKDNHIDAVGNITGAVSKARTFCGFSVKIEVECRSERDANEAASAGADCVMLDNFSPSQVADVAPRLKARFPFLIIEVSGGIREETIASFAKPGVDIISVGAITHGPPAVDISMKIRKQTSSKL